MIFILFFFFRVYTTESFDVVSVCSTDPICSIASALSPGTLTTSIPPHGTSPNQTEGQYGGIFSPTAPKNFMSKTMPTNHTPGTNEGSAHQNTVPHQNAADQSHTEEVL